MLILKTPNVRLKASRLVSSIEEDGKSIPMLLRHYLKLNGTMNFHVVQSFNNTTVVLYVRLAISNQHSVKVLRQLCLLLNRSLSVTVIY